MGGGEFFALGLAGIAAGLINTLAGGGPILTLMALTLVGIDPRIANLTSTAALLPGQLLTGQLLTGQSLTGRSPMGGTERVRLRWPILAIAVIGGGIGAGLLITTPSARFARIVPWLVLFATLAYLLAPRAAASGDALAGPPALPARALLPLAPLSIYGGYFGGGNSFLVLALLGWLGLDGKHANAVKNALIAAINGAAAAVFIVAGSVAWAAALPLALGNVAGSLIALRLLGRVSARLLRALVITSGFALAAILFARS